MIGTSIRIAPRRFLNEKTCGIVQGLSPADANLKTWFNTLCTQNTTNSSWLERKNINSFGGELVIKLI